MKKIPSKRNDTNPFSSRFPFYLTVFISAFLLFQIQPLMGKYILPWFGGSSSIWTTTVLFFMVLLLFGYTYAHILSRFPIRRQVILHLTLTGITILLLLTRIFSWSSPITPPLAFRPPDSFDPVTQVLTVLGFSVGLPFFLLSTTSTLLQRWFSRVHADRSPYPLYALSNTGSLLGLVLFPFFFEVYFPIHLQGILWTGGFLLFALVLGFSAFYVLQNGNPKVPQNEAFIFFLKGSLQRQLLWIILPLLSAVILLSVTAQITQAVAPVPFLWVLPLALYLLSFILTFSDRGLYARNLFSYALLITAPAALIVTFTIVPFMHSLIIYSIFTFSAFMVLHGELHHARPAADRLTVFYFMEAFGSAMGGILVGVLAPLLFTDYWEFYIAVIAVMSLSMFVLLLYKDSLVSSVVALFFQKRYDRLVWWTGGVLSLIIGFFAINYILQSQDKYIWTTRNFYGVIGIYEEGNDDSYRTMYNGKIDHGGQYLTPSLRKLPTTYYGEGSGVYLAVERHAKRTGRATGPMHIGVTGLGAGTLGAVGKPGDRMTFYEINPAVIQAASEHFYYLKDSEANVDIIQGDARITMQQQLQDRHPKYDVLALDAFIDDSVPVHLLTKEAFETYRRLLEPRNGILAVHVSNRYLELEPVVENAAEHFGMAHRVIYGGGGDFNRSSSTWVLLADQEETLNDPEIASASATPVKYPYVPLWTDDYSNLFLILDKEIELFYRE